MRKITNQLLSMVEEGLLDRDTLIRACLDYMSEADVADMAHAEGFIEGDDDDDDDDQD